MAGRNLDARTAFFYMATVNTPAMATKMVGKGSQDAVTSADKDGRILEGAKSYRLTIPAHAPAKDFWSLVVYDPQTRSELQTSQPFPSKNSKRDQLIVNTDGSVDLYFGPKAPAGQEPNWTETVAGKSWFAILRLYGPLEPWFEKRPVRSAVSSLRSGESALRQDVEASRHRTRRELRRRPWPLHSQATI